MAWKLALLKSVYINNRGVEFRTGDDELHHYVMYLCKAYRVKFNFFAAGEKLSPTAKRKLEQYLENSHNQWKHKSK